MGGGGCGKDDFIKREGFSKDDGGGSEKSENLMMSFVPHFERVRFGPESQVIENNILNTLVQASNQISICP